MEQPLKSTVPIAASAITWICLIAHSVLVASAKSCDTPNCDLVPGFTALAFLAVGIPSGIVCLVSLIRRKRHGIPTALFHRISFLMVLLSPALSPIITYTVIAATSSDAPSSVMRSL